LRGEEKGITCPVFRRRRNFGNLRSITILENKFVKKAGDSPRNICRLLPLPRTDRIGPTCVNVATEALHHAIEKREISSSSSSEKRGSEVVIPPDPVLSPLSPNHGAVLSKFRGVEKYNGFLPRCVVALDHDLGSPPCFPYPGMAISPPRSPVPSLIIHLSPKHSASDALPSPRGVPLSQFPQIFICLSLFARRSRTALFLK